jgi:hypothetical protein
MAAPMFKDGHIVKSVLVVPQADPDPPTSIGSLRPGGAEQIVSGTIAAETVITTLNNHGLTSGDKVFFTASTTSNPALTATPQQTVTKITDKTFSIPVNCSVGATAGAYDYAITSTPTTPGAAPLVNVGRAHGLRVGDVVTIVASGSTPSLDGAQTVTAVPSATSFRVLTSAVPTTVAGSVTAAHFSKTTYYSDVLDRGAASGGGAVGITSTIGTAPCTSTVNIQGSADGINCYNIPYALVATPRTFVVTALTITTAVATTYLLQELAFWRYLRLAVSSNTNVTHALTAVVR